VRVDRGIRCLRRRHARGDRDRVPREGARPGTPARGREPLHDVGAAAERGDGHAAADDLAEGEQVGRVLAVVPRSIPHQPGRRDAEPGEHLVGDDERAVRVRELHERAVEAGLGGTTPMFAAAASTITAAMRSPCSANGRAHGVEVVVGQHERERRDVGGHAGRAGQGERREPEPASASRPSECPW
jgi:hypothetical protein